MAQCVTITPTQTPPNSPFLAPMYPAYLTDLQKVLVEIHKAIPKLPAGIDVFAPSQEASTEPKLKASKLDFKVVDEVSSFNYKIWEAPPEEAVVELEEHIFVVRKRTDRTTANLTTFIDINSTDLRDLVRQILKDVRGIDSRQDKLSVDQNVLFHFIDDLQRHLEDHKETTTGNHLSILLNYVETTFKSTKEHLRKLLEHQEITYDLLWALFSPNTLVFTQCTGTGKPQCLKYDFGEEKKLNSTLYFSLQCRYLDFDGKVFGDACTRLPIRGSDDKHLNEAVG